jgi:uncharacterized OB-fold protein
MEPKLSVRQYYEGLNNNRLLGLKCTACGAITTPPRLACRQCGSLENETTQLAGKGSILTFTSIHVGVENRRGKTPYLVVMIKLDEGPWIMANLEGVDPSMATVDLIDKRVVMNNPPCDKTPAEGIAPVFILESTTT